MIRLEQGDCREVLRTLDADSVDAIVCDPPYGLRFMAKHWDYDLPGVDVWQECLRVLKPGGHLLAFAGTRTQHRMAVNIEDAGFEIQDMIAWVYGSGMPKHQSRLKPALEPITVARKPAEKATLLNIDACRVATTENLNGGAYAKNPTGRDQMWGGEAGNSWKRGGAGEYVQPEGRYPANLIHDGSEEVLACFPDSAGAGPSLPRVKITGYGDGAVGTGESQYLGGERIPFNSGSGSAARFFYCAKANKKDRDAGLEALEDRVLARSCQAQAEAARGNVVESGAGAFNKARIRKNNHPTVKPTDLMRYLCRLVTPPGGVVLDPFMGSGSTGKAAVLEGFRFIGIEREAEYMDIARMRIAQAIIDREQPNVK